MSWAPFFTEGTDISEEDFAKWTLPELLIAMPTINPKLDQYPHTLAFLLKDDHPEQLISLVCKHRSAPDLLDRQEVARQNTCCENATRILASNPILLQHALNEGRIITTFVTGELSSVWTVTGLFSVIDAMMLCGGGEKVLEKIKEQGCGESSVDDMELWVKVFLKHVDKYQPIAVENLVKLFTRIAPEDPSPLVSLVTKYLVHKIILENSISAVALLTVLQTKCESYYRLDHPEVVLLIRDAVHCSNSNGSGTCRSSYALVALLESFLTSSHVLVECINSTTQSATTTTTATETTTTTAEVSTINTEDAVTEVPAAITSSAEAETSTANTTASEIEVTTTAEGEVMNVEETGVTAATTAEADPATSFQDTICSNSSDDPDCTGGRNSSNISDSDFNSSIGNSCNNSSGSVPGTEKEEEDEWSSFTSAPAVPVADDDEWGDWEESPNTTPIVDNAMTEFDDWDISATYTVPAPAPPPKQPHPLVRAILQSTREGCGLLTSTQSTHQARVSLLRIYERLLDLPEDCDKEVREAFLDAHFLETLMHLIFVYPLVSVVQCRALQILRLLIRKNNFLPALLASPSFLTVTALLLKHKTAQTFSNLDTEPAKELQEALPSVSFQSNSILPSYAFLNLALEIYETSSTTGDLKRTIDQHNPAFASLWLEIGAEHFKRKTLAAPPSTDDYDSS